MLYDNWMGILRVLVVGPLAYAGLVLREAMRQERVTEDEIQAAVREQGVASLAHVEAVVLETNGKMSVVPKSEAGGEPSALSALQGFTPET